MKWAYGHFLSYISKYNEFCVEYILICATVYKFFFIIKSLKKKLSNQFHVHIWLAIINRD